MDKRRKSTFELEDRITVGIGWIHSVILFSGFYFLAASLLKRDDAEGFQFLLRTLWLIIPVVSSWLYIRKIRSFAAYILACAVTIAVTFLISRCLITAVISVFIYAVRCSPRMIRGQMMEESPGDVVQIEIWQIPTLLDEPRPLHWSFFLVFYLILIFLKRFTFMEWMFYLLLAEILLTYTYSSFDDMKTFISGNRRIANLPVSMMQRMQRAMFCITMFMLMLFVLPALIYGEEPLKRLAYIEAMPYAEAPVMQEEGNPAGDGMLEMLEAISAENQKELPEWVQTLLNVLSYAVAAVAFLFILWLLYQALRHMMQSFAQGQGSDEVILLDASGNETYGRINKKKRTDKTANVNRKIRKEYRKTILKKTGNRPSGSETPQELEIGAGIYREQEQTFHDIYEKARYSDKVCSAEELEQFRSAQKENHH